MSDKPTDDRQRLNVLSEKLEAAVQKRRETNAQQQRQQRLEVMRKALKEGRYQRKENLADQRERLYTAVQDAKFWAHPIDEEHLNQTLDRSRSQNMLAKVRRPGQKEPVEILAIKEKERYEKRPSVRAMKTEQSPETRLNLMGNRLNAAIDNRLRKETPEAIDMALHGKIMPERKAMLRYEVYLNKNLMAMFSGYQDGDKCQLVRAGKRLHGVSNDKHLSAIFDQYNSPDSAAKIKRSISVGDVIRIGKEAYSIEKNGFRKLESFRARSRSKERGAGRSM